MTPTDTTDPTYLTVREIAAEWRVSAMTVYRLVERGELPATRVGRSYRIRRKAVDAYVDGSAA